MQILVITIYIMLTWMHSYTNTVLVLYVNMIELILMLPRPFKVINTINAQVYMPVNLQFLRFRI